MKNSMRYKDYIGTIEYSDEDGCFYGKVLGVNSLIMFEGESVAQLKKSFRMMVDEYVKDCMEANIEPEKSYKGSFNVRIEPELHKRAAFQAASEGISLNAVVERAIREYLSKNYI
jgi:predicted HicB family RNase H-like nuclease